MPTETALIVGAIALVFIVFAVALGWADYYTHGAGHPGQAE